MKDFIGTCVENPFGRIEELSRIIEKGKVISKTRFMGACAVHPDTLKDMKRFPHDYEYFQSLDRIYYYEWSAIEHFYS